MGRKLQLLLVVAVAMLAVPSRAASPEHHKTISHLAQTCTAKGAFGRAFPEHGYGHVDAVAEAEWAPFRRLAISAEAGRRITAEASFSHAGDSPEQDIRHAGRFFHALDKAITEKHRFPHREAHDGGVTFHMNKEPDTGLVFNIRRERDQVIAECIDLED